MNNRKTVIEWLNEAKQQGYDWADAAIENCKKDKPYTGNSVATSLSDAIGGGFVWPAKKVSYWENIFNELEQKGL